MMLTTYNFDFLQTSVCTLIIFYYYIISVMNKHYLSKFLETFKKFDLDLKTFLNGEIFLEGEPQI